MAFERELEFARDAASRAGRLAMEYRARGVSGEDKPDDSPVTVADRECERLLAALIESAYPEDGILGEEGASKEGSSGRRWIIDPIDGTRDFLRGNRFFCNMLALEAAGECVVGVVNFPALDEVYWAAQGAGACCNGAAIGISDIPSIGRAVGCVNSMNNALTRPHAAKLLPFLARFWAIRSFGGALDAMLVCSGRAEFWLEPSAKPWDLAALRVIAAESGARFFDYTGADTIYGGNAVICTPALEGEARAFLEIASP